MNKWQPDVLGHLVLLLCWWRASISVKSARITGFVGEYLNLNVPCRSLCIVQFLFLPSSCEVSFRKQFKITPGKCRTFWVWTKRRSANHSWRPSSKAAPIIAASPYYIGLSSFLSKLIVSQSCSLTRDYQKNSLSRYVYIWPLWPTIPLINQSIEPQQAFNDCFGGSNIFTPVV